GHHDRDRLGGREERVQRIERAHAELLRHLRAPLGARVVEPHQLRARDVAEEAHVVIAESPGADDPDLELPAHITTPRPLAPTNSRKCFPSGHICSSRSARSGPCVTLSSERKKRRYARLSSCTTSGWNPLRWSPTVLSPYSLFGLPTALR